MAAATTATRIRAAAHRVLDRDGAAAVTMRRIAKATGITAMAIYRHFPNRDAVLGAVVDDGFAHLATLLTDRKLPAAFEPRLFRMIELGIDYALARPHLFALMFLDRRRGARRFPRDFRAGHSPTANALVTTIERGMASGALARDDPWEVAFELGALIDGLVMLYLGGRMERSPAALHALARRALRRHLDGIRPR